MKNVKSRRSGAELLQDLNQNFFMEKSGAPGGLELPTFWFVAVEAGNLSALRGVAYGRFCSFSYSSIVRKLYANWRNAFCPCRKPDWLDSTGRKLVSPLLDSGVEQK